MSELAFNVDMLRLAREHREQTQSDLAREAGVTQALISKIENGLVTAPSDDVVARLSEALRFPTHFFYQQGTLIGFPHFHYRKRARLGAKVLARIGATINIRRQHIAKLLRSVETSVAKPIPQIDLAESGLTPEKVAEKMRGYWLAKRGPIDNLVELIESAGGIVVLCRFGTNQLDGLSFRAEGLPPLFFMNRDVAGERFRFSLAHELGHMIMHSVPGDEAQMEDEAHRFAAAFLMPAADIRPYFTSAKLAAFGKLKAFWKVSIKALVKRAHDLKQITDNQYRWLNVQYAKSFKMGEPGQIELEKPSSLRQMMDYHLDHLGYNIAELARLLAIMPEELEKAYSQKIPSGLRLVVSN